MKTSHALLLAVLLLCGTATFAVLRLTPSATSPPSTVVPTEEKVYRELTTALVNQLTAQRLRAFTDGQKIAAGTSIDAAFWKAHAEQERYFKSGPESMRQASFERFAAISAIRKELNSSLHPSLAAQPD